MSGYTKAFRSLLTSSVWGEPDTTRIVWITLMLEADQDGIVEASVPGLARLAVVSREACETALATFLAPDPDSRTKEHEGRRIAAVDGGWVLLNHPKYRSKSSPDERRAKDAERKRQQREGEAAEPVDPPRPPEPPDVTPSHAPSQSVTAGHAGSQQADSEAEADPNPPTRARARAPGEDFPPWVAEGVESVAIDTGVRLVNVAGSFVAFEAWCQREGRAVEPNGWRFWVSKDTKTERRDAKRERDGPRPRGLKQQNPPAGPQYTRASGDFDDIPIPKEASSG